ncbi:MAG: C45 family peptidase [Verrucomicrobiales bacterium]
MKTKPPLRFLLALLVIAALAAGLWYGPLTSKESRALGGAAMRLDERLRASDSGQPGDAFTATVRVVEVEGLPKALAGGEFDLAAQFPGRLRLDGEIGDHAFRLGRDGETVWIFVPEKNLVIEGANDVPRFAGDPASTRPVVLPELRNPAPRWQLALLPAAVEIEAVEGAGNRFRCRPRGPLARLAGLPEDLVVAYTVTDAGYVAEAEISVGDKRLDLAFESFDRVPNNDANDLAWSLPPDEVEKAERVSLSHLDKFARVALANLDAKIQPLPPADGGREVLAAHGRGRLELIDGTRVLFLEGTPEEMGEQHGVLLRDEIRHLVDSIVYGVGVGTSFDKGRWFFGEIEEAQGRLEPFTDPRHLREMDAIAEATGLHPQEIRLANFFPELFHCSGFALHGTATVDGQMYHGRVLDYLRGLGLEQNAVVMVVQPDEGNAWVNVGYAGFIGTVTAMNEKQVAIGEMGGGGEGDWDGKPMAQLMREVMERADTVDDAVAIMRKAPRTCEYYYVISDAKSKRAVGLETTPEIFETIWSGESHPRLQRPIKDTVLMSSGDRYEALVDRVEANFGGFDADSARALMNRPVCMTSNIQSVLFAPDTLDFWVANADSENVASHTRYTQYNLRDLLGGADQNTDALTSTE